MELEAVRFPHRHFCSPYHETSSLQITSGSPTQAMHLPQNLNPHSVSHSHGCPLLNLQRTVGHLPPMA